MNWDAVESFRLRSYKSCWRRRFSRRVSETLERRCNEKGRDSWSQPNSELNYVRQNIVRESSPNTANTIPPPCAGASPECANAQGQETGTEGLSADRYDNHSLLTIRRRGYRVRAALTRLFCRGRFQYGDLQPGHRLGSIFASRGSHLCPQRSQTHSQTVS